MRKLLDGWQGKKWIKIITIDDLANERLDISVPPDGVSDTWKVVNRGTNTSLTTVGHVGHSMLHKKIMITGIMAQIIMRDS